MEAHQLETIRNFSKRPTTISGDYFTDRTPRTLVYGYTVERHTFHVWLTEDGLIGRMIYTHNGDVLERDVKAVWEAEDLRPNKRAYPQLSDFLFGMLMADLTEHGISFLDWEPIHPSRQETYNHPLPYHGYTTL